MIGNALGAGRGLSPSSYLPHRERPLLAGKYNVKTIQTSESNTLCKITEIFIRGSGVEE